MAVRELYLILANITRLWGIVSLKKLEISTLVFLIRFGEPNPECVVLEGIYANLCYFGNTEQPVGHDTEYHRVAESAEHAVGFLNPTDFLNFLPRQPVALPTPSITPFPADT